MKFPERVGIILAIILSCGLLLMLLPKLNPVASAQVGSGFSTFFSGLWIAVQVIFGAVVLFGLGLGWIHFKRHNTTHIIRDGRNGEQTRAIVHMGQIVHMGAGQQPQMDPQQFLALVRQCANTMLSQEYDIVEEDAPRLLPPPKAIYKLSEQIQSGATDLDEATSLVGYVQGQPLRGLLFADDGNMLDSMFIAGDSGAGKSSLGVYLAVLCILQRGKLLVIDPDAELLQSLTKRLGPLVNYLLAPIGDTPDKARKVLDVCEHLLDHPPAFPVLWLTDEFSMIMRASENKTGKWSEVGTRCAGLAEDFATRGRKRRLKAVVFGQITKATRAGGTELRDSMTTLVFRLKEGRARIILDTDEAKITPTLKDGEALVIPARSSEEVYRLQLTFVDEGSLQMVLDLLTGNAGGNKIITLISKAGQETGWKRDGNTGGNEFPSALQARLDEIDRWAEKLAKMEDLGPYAEKSDIWQAVFGHAPGGRSYQAEAAVFSVLVEAGKHRYAHKGA